MTASFAQTAWFGDSALERLALEGVRAFWLDNPPVTGTVVRNLEGVDLGAIRGLVSYLPDHARWRPLREALFPIVDTSNHSLADRIPSVIADDVAVGRAAAAFLLEKGYGDFVYISHPMTRFSAEREAGFREILTAAGRPLQVIPFPGLEHTLAPTAFVEELLALGERLLAPAPMPRAVLFFADSVGYSFLALAEKRFGPRLLRLAYMGVDVAPPPDAFGFRLSSVRPDFRTVGYEAAALLARLQSGEPAPDAPIRIDAPGVVEGDTTPPVADRPGV